jgi:parallel beta helix pectate lyase-like protein
MRKMNLLTLVALIIFGTQIVSAQATRTWVSGVGDDANPCSRTAPCKTFAGAISKTAAGGEIDALDPGGFGALTITKAITLDGGGGQVASVLVASTNGIVVQAGPGDVVILRNLRINGIAPTGTGGLNGIRWLSGKSLTVEKCNIFGFTQNGIDIAKSDGGQAYVIDTVVTSSGGRGLSSVNTSTPVHVAISHSRFEDNTFGLWAGDFSRFSVADSDIAGNAGGIVTLANADSAVMNVARTNVINNSFTGIQSGGGSNSSIVRITNVVTHGNPSFGLLATGSGQIISFGNNYNSDPGTPSSALAPQ